MRDKRTEWDLIAAEYDKKITRGDFFRKNILDTTIIKHLGNVKDKSILDLGCGQGYLSKILSLNGGIITGIDISENLISIAKKNRDITFVIGNIEERLPFSDNTFDIAVANMVFMDIENPDLAIRNVTRVLKKDGILLISILHPIFTGGEVYKRIKDKIMLKDPSFLIKTYKKERMMKWKISETNHQTTVFHRPIEYYINLLASNKFVIKNMEECTLNEEGVNGFQRMLKNIPMFLILEATIKT